MSKKKIIEIEKDNFVTIWRLGPKGSKIVEVDVFIKGQEKPILEWQYGMVGGNSLIGNVSFWLEQAILEAKGIK